MKIDELNSMLEELMLNVPKKAPELEEGAMYESPAPTTLEA